MPRLKNSKKMILVLRARIFPEIGFAQENRAV